MNLLIPVSSNLLMAMCWEAKRNIYGEISLNTPGTMGTLSAILLKEGYEPPFQIMGSKGEWVRESESYLTSVAVEIQTPHGMVSLTITQG